MQKTLSPERKQLLEAQKRERERIREETADRKLIHSWTIPWKERRKKKGGLEDSE